MEIWKAVVLGIVEGATEFLPVSSTGHLIIANALLGLSGDAAASFDVCIQGGAILAVILLFKERFIALAHVRPLTTYHRAVAAAIIPFLIAGAAFGSAVKRHLFGIESVAYALVVGGFLLIAAARRYRATDSIRPPNDSVATPTVRQAIIIGLCQLGALWPGMSRSACTILGGLIAGMPLKASAEFSFIIAVPILLAASSVDGLHAISTFSSDEILALAVGFIVSFIFAVFSLRLFMRLISAVGLEPFGWYRIALGLGVIFFLN